MIRWLLKQPDCLLYEEQPEEQPTGSLVTPPNYLIAHSSITSPETKIAIIRMFPIGSFNPFNSWFLQDLSYVNREVLQCILECGMLDYATKTRGSIEAAPINEYLLVAPGVLTGVVRTLLDEYIAMVTNSPYLSVTRRVLPPVDTINAIAGMLIDNGILPITEEGEEWIKSHPSLLQRRIQQQVHERASFPIQAHRLDDTPLTSDLKNLVCEFYGSNSRSITLLNSRLCFNREVYVAQGVTKLQASGKQENEQLGWWRDEFWDDTSPARVSVLKFRQVLNNLYDLAEKTCNDRLTCRATPNDADLEERARALQSILKELRNSPTATAARAAATNSSRSTSSSTDTVFQERFNGLVRELDRLDKKMVAKKFTLPRAPSHVGPTAAAAAASSSSPAAAAAAAAAVASASDRDDASQLASHLPANHLGGRNTTTNTSGDRGASTSASTHAGPGANTTGVGSKSGLGH